MAKVNHLEKRGYEPNLGLVASLDGQRIPGDITARRARKDWPCAAEDCDLPDISWDEMYVDLLPPLRGYAGPHSAPNHKRYHMPCALRRGIITKAAGTVDATNNRRAAIAMTKAKRAG